MTTPTDTDYETAATSADQLAAKIRSWKAGAPTPAPTPAPVPVPDAKKWKLSVDDEFTASKLDPPSGGRHMTGFPARLVLAHERDRSPACATIS